MAQGLRVLAALLEVLGFVPSILIRRLLNPVSPAPGDLPTWPLKTPLYIGHKLIQSYRHTHTHIHKNNKKRSL